LTRDVKELYEECLHDDGGARVEKAKPSPGTSTAVQGNTNMQQEEPTMGKNEVITV
jgi:hypothetical protein